MAKINKKKLYQIAAASGIVAIPTATTLGIVYGTQEDKVRMYAKTAETYGEKFFDEFVADSSSSIVPQRLITPFRPHAQGGTLTELTRLERDFDTDAAHKIIKRDKNGAESFALKRVKVRTQDILTKDQLESAFKDANKELYQFVHSPLMQGRNLAIHIGQDMRNREIVASIYEVKSLDGQDLVDAKGILDDLGTDPFGPFKNDSTGAYDATGTINPNGFMQILSSEGMIYGKLKYYLNLKDSTSSATPSIWSNPEYINSVKQGAGVSYSGHLIGDDSVSLADEKAFDDKYGYTSKTIDQWNENRGDLYKVASLVSDDTGSHGLHDGLRKKNIVAFYEPSIDWIRKELVITYNIYKMDKNSTFYFGQADSIKNPVAVYKKVVRKSLSMFGSVQTLSKTNTSAGAVPTPGQKTEHDEFKDILKDFFTRQIVRYLANPIVKPGLGLLGKLIPSAAAAFGDLMSLGQILSHDTGTPNVPVTDLGHPMNPNYVPMNGKGDQSWHKYIYQGIFNDDDPKKNEGTALLESIIDKLEKDPAVDVKGVMKTMKEFQYHAFGDGNSDNSNYPKDYWTNQEHLSQTFTYNGGQYHLYQMASAFNSISALLYKAIDVKYPGRDLITKNEDLVGDLMRLLKTRGVVPADYSITNLLSDPTGELFRILVGMGKKGVVLPIDMAKKILPLVPFAGISNNIDGWANALSYLTQPGNINAVLKLLGNNEADQLKNFKELLSAGTRWEALDRIFAPKLVTQQSIMVLMKTIKLTGILPSALNAVLGDTPTKADIYVKLFANGGAQSLFHMIRDIFSKGLLKMGASQEISGINLAVGSETVMSSADLATTKTWMHSLPEFVKRYLLIEISPTVGGTAIVSTDLNLKLDSALANPTGATTPVAITYAKLKEAFEKTEVLIKNKFVKDLFTVQEGLDDKIHNFTLNTDTKIETFYDKDDSETKTLRNFERWLMNLYTDVSEYYHLSELGSTTEEIASGVEVSRRRLVLQTRYAEYYKTEKDAKREPVEYNNWRRNLYAPKDEGFYAHTVKDAYFKLSEKDLVAKHTEIYVEGYLKTNNRTEYDKFIKAREAAIKLTCAVAESFGLALPPSTERTADILWDLGRKIYAEFKAIREQASNRGRDTLAQIREIERHLQNNGTTHATHTITLTQNEWDIMPAFEDEAEGIGNIFLTTKNRNAIAKWIFEQKDSIKNYIVAKGLISGFTAGSTEAQIRAELTFEKFGYTELQNIYKAFSIEEEVKTQQLNDLLLTDGTVADSVFAFGTRATDDALAPTNSKKKILDWIESKDDLKYIDNFATYISKTMWSFNHLAPLYASSEVPTDASSSQVEKDAFKAKAITSIKAILDMPDFNMGVLELTFRQLMPIDAFTAYAHELGPKLIDAALTGDLASYAPTAGVVVNILFGVIDNLLRKPITYHSQYSIFGQIKPELGSADFTANALLFPVLGILGQKVPALQKYVPDADTLQKALSNIFDILRDGMRPFFQSTADALKDQGYTFNQTIDALLSMNILKAFFPSGFVKGNAGEDGALSVPAVSTVVGGLLHGFGSSEDMITAIKGIMPSVEDDIPVLGSVANILKGIYNNGKLSLGNATGFVHDDALLSRAGLALQNLLTKGLLNMDKTEIASVLTALKDVALKANEIKSGLGVFSSFLSGEKIDSIFKVFENLTKGLTSTTIPAISEALDAIMHKPFKDISSDQINSVIDFVNSLGLLKSNIPHLGHLVHALFAPGGLSDSINGINALDIKNLMSVLGMSDSTSEIIIKAFFGEDFKADFMKSTNAWIQTIKTNMPVKETLATGARALPNGVQSFENLKSLLDAAIAQLKAKLDPNNPAPIAELYKQHDIVEQTKDKLFEYNALVRSRNAEADALIANITTISGQTLPTEVAQTGLTHDQIALLEGRTYTALIGVWNDIKTNNPDLTTKTYDELIGIKNQYIRALKNINDYNADVTSLKNNQPIETSVQKLAKLVRQVTGASDSETTVLINVEQMKVLVNTYGVRVFQDKSGYPAWSLITAKHGFLTTNDLSGDLTKTEITSNLFKSSWLSGSKKIKVDLNTMSILQATYG